MSVAEAQMPRILYVPDYSSSAGQEAVELAELAGLYLDPWQRLVLEGALAEGPDGRWAAAEVGLCLPRQNGKNAVLEARELAALFLLDEHLTIHSAQQFKTAKEHCLRLLGLIESTPELDRRVQRVVRAHGEEAIELRDGKRILFIARNKAAGRGFSAPLIVYDEAMFLAEVAVGALTFTQAAQPNRQRWYAGSAVDQTVTADGVVFARVRDRALRGTDPRLAYYEWSLDAEHPGELDRDELADEENWRRSNPAYGIRITEEVVGDELRSLPQRTFAVERLNVGDWPDPDPDAETIISLERWAELVDEQSELADPVCFAFDVAPDRATSAVAAAGRRSDGLFHVEIIDHRRGTGWLVPRLAELNQRWSTVATMLDAAGPAGSLVHRCEEAGFWPELVSAADHARACGLLVDTVDEEQLRHLGTPELVAALKGATKRPLGDAWAWSRKNSAVDICPLVAATLALWGASTLGWDPSENPTIW